MGQSPKPPHGNADRRAEIRRRKLAARRAGRAEDLAARRALDLDALEGLERAADVRTRALAALDAVGGLAVELSGPITPPAPTPTPAALEALAAQYPPRGRRRDG